MLLGQDRGRHQVYHLTALLHRLKGGPDCDLRFAEAHVAADQPVHDPAAFHIRLYGLHGPQLVIGLLMLEQLLKLPLPHRVRPVTEARRLAASGIKLHQLFGDIFDGTADPLPGPLPFGAVQLVQLRLFSFRP